MSTYFNDIITALDAHLAALGDGTPIAWSNIDYKPTLGVTFYRPRYIPVSTNQSSLGASGKDLTLGIYQIDVVSPVGSGRSQLMDAVADHFSRGTVLVQGTTTVTVRTVQIESPLLTDAWYAVPISVDIYSYTGAR